MIPLAQDPFFSSMAVCIMFGLSFACVLTLLVMPALYAIFFGIDESTPAHVADGGTTGK
jgi:multidrug efflux pump subunit AcrB